VVIATANPVLSRRWKVQHSDIKLPPEVLEDPFAADSTGTLNLNTFCRPA